MVISIGAAAFWIALAAVLISGSDFGVRREKLRQETLLKLIERIMITTWLEEIRLNKLAYAAGLDADSCGEYRDTTAERLDLDDALAVLPPEVRLCVVLAYNDGLSHPEIAALTELPLGTVKSHIAHGAARLRETLAAASDRRGPQTRGAAQPAAASGRRHRADCPVAAPHRRLGVDIVAAATKWARIW